MVAQAGNRGQQKGLRIARKFIIDAQFYLRIKQMTSQKIVCHDQLDALVNTVLQNLQTVSDYSACSQIEGTNGSWCLNKAKGNIVMNVRNETGILKKTIEIEFYDATGKHITDFKELQASLQLAYKLTPFTLATKYIVNFGPVQSGSNRQTKAPRIPPP